MLLSALVLSGLLSAAPQRTPYSAEDLALMRQTTELAISPDGCALAFASDISGAQELWTAPACVPGGRSLPAEPLWPSQLSGLGERAGEVRFSPDGSKIVFASDRGGDERRNLFWADAASGQVERLTNDLLAETDPDDVQGGAAFSPDGAFLAYTADPGERFLFQLVVMDLRTKAARVLTHEPLGVRFPRWSPDGRTIAVARFGDDRGGDLLLVDAASGEHAAVSPPVAGGAILPQAFSPDGKSLLCVAGNKTGFMQLALVPTAPSVGRETIKFIGPDHWDVESARWHPKTGIFYVRDENGQSALYRMKTAGAKPELLVGPAGRIAAFDLDASGERLAYLWGDSTRPADAWVLDLNSKARRRLTRSETGGVDTERLSRGRMILYPSFDSADISALYIPPASGRLGAPPPVVVAPHDGPRRQARDEFQPGLQALAEAGFAVLAPNYRGSAGYGTTFRDLAAKDWGGGDLKDLVAGVDYLASQGLADPQRAGIAGAGYGGYLALMALTKTPKRWKGGVESCGIPDLALDCELSGRRCAQRYGNLIGSPKTDPALLKDRSVNFLDGVMAPLLIFQGENDTSVPPEESRLLYQKLLERKTPTGLVLYPEEGHRFTKRRDRADYYRRSVDFFVKELSR